MLSFREKRCCQRADKQHLASVKNKGSQFQHCSGLKILELMSSADVFFQHNPAAPASLSKHVAPWPVCCKTTSHFSSASADTSSTEEEKAQHSLTPCYSLLMREPSLTHAHTSWFKFHSPGVIITPTTVILHSLVPSAAWWIAGESGSGWTGGSWGCSLGQSGFPGAGNPFSPAVLPAADPGSAAPAAYLHHKRAQVRNRASLLSAQQKGIIFRPRTCCWIFGHVERYFWNCSE